MAGAGRVLRIYDMPPGVTPQIAERCGAVDQALIITAPHTGMRWGELAGPLARYRCPAWRLASRTKTWPRGRDCMPRVGWSDGAQGPLHGRPYTPPWSGIRASPYSFTSSRKLPPYNRTTSTEDNTRSSGPSLLTRTWPFDT
jgi:hypothetical protein